MRIAFGVITLCKGGAQRMLAELANGLIDRGHEVTVVMPSEGVIDYPLRAKIIRTVKPNVIEASDYPLSDVIVSNYYTTVQAAQDASLQGKGKHIRISLCYEPTFLPDNDVTFTSYHTTKQLIVLSNWQQQIIRLNHGINGQLVPVGIGPEFHNLGIRKEHAPLKIAAIVRRLEDGNWHRQQDYLLNVLRNIKIKNPQIQISLIVPPNEFATSESLKKIRLEKNFRFILPHNDNVLNQAYNQTDIFVNSSIYDTASLPGLEAMKCGAALVTTYNGGNADYARHEQNCLLSYRYQNRLQHDVERLINDPALRKRLAIEGEREANNWTWEKSVTLFEAALTYFVNDK